MFPFFNYYQIAQLNCKFEILTNSPECMTLLAKIMLKIVEKSFSHQNMQVRVSSNN